MVLPMEITWDLDFYGKPMVYPWNFMGFPWNSHENFRKGSFNIGSLIVLFLELLVKLKESILGSCFFKCLLIIEGSFLHKSVNSVDDSASCCSSSYSSISNKISSFNCITLVNFSLIVSRIF